MRHPAVLEKVREEIGVIVGHETDFDRDDLQKMEYLTMVLKESKDLDDKGVTCADLLAALRLFPPVPVNTRTALRTTFLPTGGGKDESAPVLVPKGRAVAYSVYSLHRRADLYGKDAEDFRPERWQEELGLFRDETTTHWGYLPFNGGPRQCLGSKRFLVYFHAASISEQLDFS